MAKKMSKFKSAAPNKLQMMIFWVVSSITFRSKWINKKITTVSEISDFQSWVKRNFQDSKLFLKREDLWLEMLKNSTNRKRIIELGVAWGYTTNWFLEVGFPLQKNSMNPGKPDVMIEAFDLFTGLPEAWRNHPENYFDNKGVPPKINDERVTFHVGFVEKTIRNLDLKTLINDELIVLFDLDLYQPSLESYNYLKPALKNGDFLYFDEAFDQDERRILNNSVLKDFLLKPIGHTALSICFRIEGIRNKD